MNILNQEKLLFEQTQFFNNIRPRHMNPTFVSSNVCTSLGNSIYRSQSMKSLKQQNYISLNMMNQRTSTDSRHQRMGKNSSRSSFQLKSQSNLFNYGMNSLSPIRRQIIDKDVYQKQSKKYDIITIQPKTFLDSINVFPKLRLQNSDQNFYKKSLMQSGIVLRKKNPEQMRRAQSVLEKKLDIYPQSTQNLQMNFKPT